MRHLKSILTGPPGGWRYTEPTTGFSMKAITFSSLVSKVAQHRGNMKIEPDPKYRLSEIIEDAICNSLSNEDQLRHCKSGIRIRTSVGWTEVMRFLKTAAAWIVAGAQLVPQEEAERRAQICVQCPLNVGMGGCAPCKGAVSAFRDQFLRRSTTVDERLKSCGVCGCDNRTQVHVPLDVLTRARETLEYPGFCWKAHQSL